MLRDGLFMCLLLFVCAICVECKTCESLDIRNEVKELEKLRGCTEIIGFLRILLIERVEGAYEYDEYVFPELTRITGYLFFYNVYHLTSVAKLFPNLMVIRGYELFTDYALVIYNMPHLVEIGTDKLMYIARGFVKIDKCPRLCFANSINWADIGTRLVFNNMNNGTCDACSRVCERHCWSPERCQIRSTKCHRECLGCTKPNSNRHCLVCKNYNDHGRCVAECPRGKYTQRASFKCVTESECEQSLKGTWWVYNDECLDECPSQYQQIFDRGITCEFCGNNCTKWCTPIHPIDTLDKLQELKGCTHINGSLRISMTHVSRVIEAGIVNELEAYLSSVKYIRDFLVISRTTSLYSLDFLSSIEVIEGQKLENGRFSIFVYENKNLQRLWNLTQVPLKVKSGTFGFFSNPLLCVNLIKALAEASGVPSNFSDLEVYGNGDKISCNQVVLNSTVIAYATTAKVTWIVPKLDKTEIYVGYTVYYLPHVEGEILLMDSKNYCGGSKWNSEFSRGTAAELKNLEPFTRYAYYIQIYQSSNNGAQTDVKYFTTLSTEPEQPNDFTVRALDYHTLHLTWMPPDRTNGVLSHYQLYVVKESNRDILFERDYCVHPRTEEGDRVDEFVSDEEQEIIDHAKKKLLEECTCKEQNKEEITAEEVGILSWDDHLPLCIAQSQSIFGFDDCKHLRYNALEEVEINKNSDIFTVQKRSKITHNTVKKARANKYIEIDANLTDYKLKFLEHFSMYIVYFAACNEGHKCGPVIQNFARTKKRENADDITRVTTKVEDFDVIVEWDEPKIPNGVIVSYHIEYRKLDLERSKPTIECLSRSYNYKNFVTNRKSLKNLLPGSYEVRVQAVSYGSYGRFSEPHQFIILPPPKNSDWVVPFISLLLIGFLLVIILYIHYRRKRRLENLHLIASVNPDYDGQIYIEDEWERDRSDIELQAEIGHGSFGMVYYGVINSKNIHCAVKTVNENATPYECLAFLNEGSRMKEFSESHHVVKLLGIVSKGQPPMVIMELMGRGDLKMYLRNYRENSQHITVNEIYRMAIEIADGMAYLCAKKYVHRDLAARNCMVAHDRTVKIGDFGMARDIYETDYYKKGTKGFVPVRWMAPESIADGISTSDSDAWSYGMVLWEIATYAEQPYQGMSNEMVINFVLSGGRLTRPTECTDLMYEIMARCWKWNPRERPTFMEIVERLEDHVGPDFKVLSFLHSRQGLTFKMNYVRPDNRPAMLRGARESDLEAAHYESDEEASLYVGSNFSNRPRFLSSSITQRLNRFSPGDIL